MVLILMSGRRAPDRPDVKIKNHRLGQCGAEPLIARLPFRNVGIKGLRNSCASKVRRVNIFSLDGLGWLCLTHAMRLCDTHNAAGRMYDL